MTLPAFRRRRSSPVVTGISVATYVEDTFSGASGTINGRTPDTTSAGAWQVFSGAITVDGTGHAVSATGGYATAESSHADCVIRSTISNTSGEFGFLFRRVDSINYWRLYYAPGTGWKLSKYIGNVETVVMAFTATPLPVVGQELMVVLAGNAITITMGGNAVFSGSDAQFNTATKHGLVSINGGSQQWDNFTVKSA